MRPGGMCATLAGSLFAATLAWGGSAQLTWTAPTQDVQGQPLAYTPRHRVYQGAAPGVYDRIYDIGEATSLSLTELPAGTTLFWVVTALSPEGVESAPSNEVSKAMPPDGEGDVTPPTVTITSPLDGATIPRNTTLTMQASAADNVGVAQVLINVLRNGAVIHSCTDISAPYTCAWAVPGTPNRQYIIATVAEDTAGNLSTIHQIRVTSQ